MAAAPAGDAIWISVLPDMSKFGKEMQRTTGPAAEKSGESVGSRMSRGIGKTLKRGAAVAAAGGAAAIGMSLYKGFQRLQGIDQAEAKLRGLGHTSKGVQGIMDNALASVKGTAFGLDAAATTAAGAVAAGIKPGKELERTLTLVGDTATIAGVGMDEMGAIFNKVASSDMIQGDVLAQLGDKGIPVLQMLGKEMGVSATEVRKLASEGKVDFATFQAAMEEGLGGAAQESGKTFSGAVANTKAAMGRLGAVILGPVFKRIPGLLEGVMERIDSLGPAAEKAGELLGSAFQYIGDAITKHVVPPLRAFGGFLRDDVVPAMQTFGGWAKDNIGLLKLIAGVVGAATAAYLIYSSTVKVVTAATKAWAAIQKVLNTQLALNPIGLVVVALVALGAALVIAYKKSDTFREVVDKAWAAIRKAVARAWDGYIKPALRAFWGFIQNNLIPVVKFLWANVVQPVFRQIGRIIREVWNVFIQPALKAWWYYISNVLFPIVRALWQNVVQPVMTKVGGKIRDVWQNWISPAFVAISGFITDTLIPAFRRARDRIVEFWNKIKDAAKTPVGFVINTIWNDGLRVMIGKIPGVDEPAKIEGFAGGGWTGPGSKYKPAGIVHADEHVFTKEEAAAFPGGHAGLSRLRAALRGYANGGRVWPVPGRQISTYAGHDGVDINRGSGWDDYGDPIWAAAGGTVSYVGTGRGYGLATFVRGPYGELVYGHMSRTAQRAGTRVGAGTLLGAVGNTGNSSAPHLHFGFPGGTYAQALAFLRGADMSGGDDSEGGGFGDLIRAARSVWKGIRGMASSGWAGLMKTGATGMARDVKDWINDKIPGPGPIPGGIFDTGGWLMPGAAAVNLSTEPEPVFSGAQWRTLSAAVAGGSGGKGRLNDSSGIANVIAAFDIKAGGTVKDLRAELQKLRKALRDVGGKWTDAMKRQAARAVDLTRRYARQSKVLEASREALQAMRAKATEFATAVGQTFNNSIFGKGVAGLATQLQADTNDSRALARALRQAAGKGLDGPLLEALAQSGDLTTAQELAEMTAAQIQQYEDMYAARVAAQQNLGRTARGLVYGDSLTDQRELVARQTQTLDRLANQMQNLEERLEAGVHRGALAGIRGKNRTQNAKARAK